MFTMISQALFLAVNTYFFVRFPSVANGLCMALMAASTGFAFGIRLMSRR